MSGSSVYMEWLLEGDPSIVYLTHRDLLGSNITTLHELQKRIEKEGWGARLLTQQDEQTGLWGKGLYSPKWISTTYTMLDLKRMGIDPANSRFQRGAHLLIEGLWRIPVKKNERPVDLCIAGMLLDLCCYARIEHPHFKEIVDYVMDHVMPGGGWNCRWEESPHHASLHTTINLLEGIMEYLSNGYDYRSDELAAAALEAHEFILMHRLYLSDHTSEVISKQMTMLSYPPRWRYDVLRAMDYFQRAGVEWDPRMEEAMNLIRSKRLKSGKWPVQLKHPGRVYFNMEAAGKESRWNTLRVLRVLRSYARKEAEEFILTDDQ